MRKPGRLIAMILAASVLFGGSAYADPAPPADSETDASVCASGRTLAVSGGVNTVMADASITLLRPDSQADTGFSPLPPDWTLGVTGESGPIELRDAGPSLSLIRTDVTGGGWGVLTSENSRGASFAAIDADLNIRPGADGAGAAVLGYEQDAPGAGYGIYCGPDSETYLYGSGISGAAYGAVLDGAGSVWFGSSTGTIPLYDAAGGMTGVEAGQGRASSVDSVFGLLLLNGADNVVTVDEGTALHTRDAAVLYKGGSGEMRFNNARVCSDSGVLLRMMDDDADRRADTDPETGSGLYDERDGGGSAGFPGIAYDCPSAPAASDEPDPALPPDEPAGHLAVAYTNGLYQGDIYNGTGWYGQPGDSLTVTVGKGAVLYGDITLTSSVKAIPYREEALDALSHLDGVRYELLDRNGVPCDAADAAYIQFMAYTSRQYYLQGHMQDLPYANGASSLDIAVAEGGTWVARERSLASSLTVEDGASVYAKAHVRHDGTVILIPSLEKLAPGYYGPAATTDITDQIAPQPD